MIYANFMNCAVSSSVLPGIMLLNATDLGIRKTGETRGISVIQPQITVKSFMGARTG